MENCPHIAVCICTFRRPELLRRLLNELRELRTDKRFTYTIVVADNDRDESARQTVTEFVESGAVQTVYCVEPVQNIALARNRAVAHAKGDLVAFIDDDEFPVKDWLFHLHAAMERYGVDGVLG